MLDLLLLTMRPRDYLRHLTPCHEFVGSSKTLLHMELEPKCSDACRLTFNRAGNTDCSTINPLAKDPHTRNECASYLRCNLGEKLFAPSFRIKIEGIVLSFLLCCCNGQSLFSQPFSLYIYIRMYYTFFLKP